MVTEHVAPPAIEIRIDGTAGTLAAAGGAVRAMATAAGLHPDRATRFRVVVEELVREALAREYQGDTNEVVVGVRSDAGVLHVDVTDQALPVTGAEARVAPSRRLAALGFVDELHIANHGVTGNVAECSVSVAGPDHTVVGDVLDDDAPGATDDEAGALEVRAMNAGDAPGLARCIYRCYGYTYKDQTLYEPRHIAQALGRQLLRSVVAVTPSGEVVGHCALFVQRPGDRVPEAGKLVVDPRFRSHHLAERMAAVRLDAAKDDGIPGFWAQAVTNHPWSQKEIAHLGGAEVGLLIGASPATVAMTALADVTVGRRSLVAMYTPLERRSQTIYVPALHVDLMADMQGELGLDRSFAVGRERGRGPSKVRVIVAPDAGTAHIRVEHAGADVLTRIADELDGLDAFDLGAVHLDVGLAEPGAGIVATELDRLGFCFAAWLPGFAPSGDVLRLQRVGGHPVDVEHVVCARSQGERVRDYVVADWHRVRRGGVA